MKTKAIRYLGPLSEVSTKWGVLKRGEVTEGVPEDLAEELCENRPEEFEAVGSKARKGRKVKPVQEEVEGDA